MTNLVEKLLITGFGIFILVSFLLIISPFTDIIYDYDDYQEDLDNILMNINDIDQSIEYISIYHNESFFEEIEIYHNLNISVEEFNIEYSFIINQNQKSIKSNHIIKLKIKDFELISKKKYLLNLSYDLFSIDINFILMN